ncbi:sugar ABC transporter ATP-binding protein [Oribacterium sp. oral taxon 108]|uniref:sugar ABC transporter ATP-binding protein n=1 Tax=Oribacterium sp. oral taxon 108 TaxID=712414 RepID=UPI00020DDBC7|nr:sugar ABC transporter ATP-binding protein [Oribacterium sp. oral taxon 108]EGL38127.1 ribose transport ATP-binding protein rbsa [Oribacterium sp. oral taxon 108 str. F0425]
MGNSLVQMKNIAKSFSGTKVLKGVNLELGHGEILALLGENGAGKSTLMKILSGIYSKDSGEIYLDGELCHFQNPKEAQNKGVAIIHQEMNLCNDLSVSENIFLGREVMDGLRLNHKKMDEEAQKILDDLGISMKSTELAGDLKVSEQQMVEIAKALSQDAKVLIMDEPTSALSRKEIEDLFRVIRKLRDEGRGIIYISHRLDELRAIADKVSILRDGENVISGDLKDFSIDDIIRHMVGREIQDKFPRILCEKGKEILRVESLNAGPKVRDISFSLYEGEILGIAGLMGAGRTEMTRALFGVDEKTSGKIYLFGEEVKTNTPKDSIELGMALIPEDRRKDGLCTDLSIRENISLPNLDSMKKSLGVLSKDLELKISEDTIKSLNVKAKDREMISKNLSGGNQQKVVLGKWLVRNPKVILFDEPTRGIDIGAKVEIYQIMNELKKKGVGVLFISSEMEEVLGMSDRILIFCDGRITGELSREEANQENILKLATRYEEKV